MRFTSEELGDVYESVPDLTVDEMRQALKDEGFSLVRFVDNASGDAPGRIVVKESDNLHVMPDLPGELTDTDVERLLDDGDST